MAAEGGVRSRLAGRFLAVDATMLTIVTLRVEGGRREAGSFDGS
jgi:hypothetical protein